MARFSSHRITAWVPRIWSIKRFGTARVYAQGGGWGRKFLIENALMRAQLAARRHDVVFSLGDTSLPMCRQPHMLLVQTPYLAYAPDDLEFPIARRFRARIELISRYFEIGRPSVDIFTVQSKHMQQRLARRWGIPLERIRVIPSAILLDVRDSQLASGGYLAYVSTASPHKNHEIFANIMALLADQGITLPLRVTVTPDHVPELAEAASRRGVLDRIEFLGNISHQAATDLIAGAAAVVNPSRLETYGLTYYEAMAQGVPVVAADRDFAREACAEAGLYADPDDACSFALRIAEALDRRAELGQRGLSRARSIQIGWEEVAVRYLDLIEEISAR